MGKNVTGGGGGRNLYKARNLISFFKKKSPIENEKNTSFKIGVFADKEVGKSVVEYLLGYHRSHVAFICLINEKSEILYYLQQCGFPENQIYFWDELKKQEQIKSLNATYFLLAWWPYIVKKEILQLPKYGVLNFHPSLLPYARGKNYNFWSIVNKNPFGVTIHFVDEKIDSGDVVFQKQIPVSWEDTGKSLYEKAQMEMINLFKDNYHKLVEGRYIRRIQNLNQGDFHFGFEMERKSEIKLKEFLKVEDLLNLLRAKTFKPYQGCCFFDDGKKYEIHIDIKEIIKEVDKDERSN